VAASAAMPSRYGGPVPRRQACGQRPFGIVTRDRDLCRLVGFRPRPPGLVMISPGYNASRGCHLSLDVAAV